VQGKAWREEIPQASPASLSPLPLSLASPLLFPKLRTREKLQRVQICVSTMISWWYMSELRGGGMLDAGGGGFRRVHLGARITSAGEDRVFQNPC
jgi:hypothetical protein